MLKKRKRNNIKKDDIMKEIRIEEIENGYTIYSNCKTHFVSSKEEVIEFIQKNL